MPEQCHFRPMAESHWTHHFISGAPDIVGRNVGPADARLASCRNTNVIFTAVVLMYNGYSSEIFLSRNPWFVGIWQMLAWLLYDGLVYSFLCLTLGMS